MDVHRRCALPHNHCTWYALPRSSDELLHCRDMVGKLGIGLLGSLLEKVPRARAYPLRVGVRLRVWELGYRSHEPSSTSFCREVASGALPSQTFSWES